MERDVTWPWRLASMFFRSPFYHSCGRQTSFLLYYFRGLVAGRLDRTTLL